MKKLAPTVAALAVLILTACAGVKARENVLMPAMSQAYSTSIQPMVQRGAELPGVDSSAVEAADVAMVEALDSGERERVAAVDWSLLRAAAEGDVSARLQAGEIGPGVAASLRGLLEEFTVQRARLLAR